VDEKGRRDIIYSVVIEVIPTAVRAVMFFVPTII